MTGICGTWKRRLILSDVNGVESFVRYLVLDTTQLKTAFDMFRHIEQNGWMHIREAHSKSACWDSLGRSALWPPKIF